MKIYLAADHAGFRLKSVLAEQLALMGHDIEDVGAHELNPDDDYPDFAHPLAQAVATNPGTFGVMCCGTGQGEAMVANRTAGVRAAVFYGLVPATEALDHEGARSEDGYDIVRLARKHNDANVLTIGARFVSASDAVEAVRVFLAEPFSTDERHHRRVAKF